MSPAATATITTAAVARESPDLGEIFNYPGRPSQSRSLQSGLALSLDRLLAACLSVFLAVGPRRQVVGRS
jgi:hypothetical protein